MDFLRAVAAGSAYSVCIPQCCIACALHKGPDDLLGWTSVSSHRSFALAQWCSGLDLEWIHLTRQASWLWIAHWQPTLTHESSSAQDPCDAWRAALFSDVFRLQVTANLAFAALLHADAQQGDAMASASDILEPTLWTLSTPCNCLGCVEMWTEGSEATTDTPT